MTAVDVNALASLTAAGDITQAVEDLNQRLADASAEIERFSGRPDQLGRLRAALSNRTEIAFALQMLQANLELAQG